MQLDTTRFGTVDIADDSIITFTQPILGFQEFRRYTLLQGPAESNVTWLQSTDSGELAFLLMDPRSVMPDYAVELSERELTELAVSSVDELEVYTLVVVPAGDSKQVRTNLKAPILISPKHRLGKQIILDRDDYPIQFFLAQTQMTDDKSKEVSNARSNA